MPIRPARFLDVREMPAPRLADCASIPFSQLPARQNELPPKGTKIEVIESKSAATWLTANGWPAIVVERPTEESDQSFALWSPNTFLTECLLQISPKKVLDLGCGNGRDATYLASLGCRVTAIDHLPDAIERGRAFSRNFPCVHPIKWYVTKATTAALQFANNVDLAIMMFFYDREALDMLADQMDPGSYVCIEGFTAENAAKNQKPGLDKQVPPSAQLPEEFRVLIEDADWRGDRHTRRLLLQRR